MSALSLAACGGGGGEDPPNQAPSAASAAIATGEDTASAPVTPTVTDADAGDTFTFAIVTQPANGTATVVNNQLVYTPSADFSGADSFTFRATDAGGLSVTGTANVMVALGTNDAPSAASATLATNEDTASAPTAPAVTDADPGDTFTFTIVTQPTNGSATVVNNQLVYTPHANYNGADSFTFRAVDAGGLGVTGTANVTVTAVNDALTDTGGSRAVYAGASGTRTTWVEDVDLWEDSYTFQVVTQPTSGSVSFSGGAWTYTPSSSTASGTDSFTYQATDSGGASVTGTGKVRVYDSAALTQCTRNSTVNPDGTLNARTRSNPCAYYSSTQTRTAANGSAVTMDYFGNRPSNNAAVKAVVVLIGGSDLNMNLTGNSTTGVADDTGGANFLVRTAQLFAEAGYVAIALDRPSDLTTDTAQVDQYRISVQHAVDILRIVRRSNPANLDVFIVGTSRGAISAVAQNRIATAIGISSPVTSNGSLPALLYVGRPDTPSLLPTFVQRPALVSWHESDLCAVTTPTASQALVSSLLAAGVSATSSVKTGGVPVTSPLEVCGAQHYHGYLGIETSAVASFTDWLNARVAAGAGNKRPDTAFATVSAAAGTSTQIPLARYVRDVDGDTLTYALSHTSTTLGGTVSITGTTVTYTPPAGVTSGSDNFVYIVTDGRGGVGAAVVTVQIGS